MVSYNGLLAALKRRGLTKSDLIRAVGLSSRTVAKIGRGEKLSEAVLARIARFLDQPTATLAEPVADNPLLQALREEKRIGLSGGLYHELQILLTYNSNHIEGSRLSERQTRMIFETHTVDTGEGIPIDDIIETVNHFRAVDYVLDIAEERLTEDHIKAIHRLLKQNTKDAALPWFAVGEYKKRPNVVGGLETARPGEVPERMRALIATYRTLPAVTIEDIVAFLYQFERIHPFQDGNGRVGRLIAFKECLRFRIVPFLIEDAKKFYYYRGLARWEEQKGYLIDTCLDGQDTFRRLMAAFDVPE